MPPVFAHGRLRLYLLKLLDEAPRHGYEVIRLLEERFQGLYAPSAGTVYPRLAKLEAEGLVSHTTEGGGRKVYSITEAGRAELADREDELAELEVEISASLTALAADIREDVSGSARDLRREMREQARRTRTDNGGWAAHGWPGPAEKEAWQQAKEEMKRAKEEWKEQARRAKRETQQAKRQVKEAQARAAAVEEVQRIARQVQDQVQSRAKSGDWPGAVREGMSQLAREMGNLDRITDHTTAWFPYARHEGPMSGESERPDWAREKDAPSDDPARDLERLLDHFRDDVRDAARDHGVTEGQLSEARRRLSATAEHLVALLRAGEGHADGD
ncbi:PadR family transcriptional regulator [Streptomyces marispadix]|uniref:Helix-turn-helix transcriptional regulator n=1 Tax=Streptomyces marispadix TaxID=2922868 RepID=A0ABS9T1V7_9ACTN|nr:helix-turn-helix transcriptional regulator [Streptomyces marispadix]MCH6162500.1 helix-turn-helix transcriptional regulator [Streptomyces marispadix]